LFIFINLKFQLMNSFKDINVIITGADGFIASHVCEFLISEGAKVVGLVRRSSSGTLKNIEHISNKMKIVWGDTVDPSTINQVTQGVEIIYHLAALSHVGYSIKNPYETFFNNTISTLNVLEAARKNDVSRIIHAGSSEQYGNPTSLPINEDAPLLPRSPYAASKTASDRLIYSYFTTYGLPVVMSRFFNIYGPRQGIEKAIPKFILQVLNKVSPTVYGNGKQTRDFTYVTDAVKAYSLLGVTRKIEGKILNIGYGKEITILELAKLIIYLLGTKLKPKFKGTLRSGETPRLLCDNSKTKKLLKWQPEVDLSSGLKKTIEYYKGKKKLYSYLKILT